MGPLVASVRTVNRKFNLESIGLIVHHLLMKRLSILQQRISNNSCDLLGGESLNPLFALFNHSCDPNVDWSSAAGNHRTIMVRARRNIRKGEQLLVEYDQFMRDQRLHIRRERYYR